MSPPRLPRAGRTAAWAAVLAVTAAVYGAHLGNGFVWDDHAMIVGHPAVVGTDGWGRTLGGELTYHLGGAGTQMAYYRPALVATFRALWWAGGGAPWAFHAASVLLQLLCATLALALLPRLGVPRGLAFGAAALFAVHPLAAESVYWAGTLQELLALGSLLGTLLALSAARDAPPGRRPALAAAAFVASALGAFAKETAVVVPALAAIEAVTTPGDRLRRLRATWPAWAGAAVYLAARAALVPRGMPLALDALPSRVARAGEIAAWSLARLVVPLPLSPIHELPARSPVLLAGLAVALALAVALLARRLPRGLFWAAWIVLPLAPAAAQAFVALETQLPVAERRLFLSLLPALVAAGAGALALARRLSPRRGPAALAAVAAVLGAASAGVTAAYGAVWRDDDALFSRVVALYPTQPHALNALGASALRRGDAAGAARLLEAARASQPRFPQTHMALGEALRRLGRTEEALAAYATAAAVDRDLAVPAALARGDALRDAGRLDLAGAEYARAVAADGANPVARLALGTLLYVQGDPAGALAQWEAGDAAAPGTCELGFNLTMAYVALGRGDAARLRGAQFLRACGAGWEPQRAQVEAWLRAR